LWVFEDGAPDQRLDLLAAELLSKAGRRGDAEAHLQRAFEKEPSLELYKRLCNLGGEAARQRAVKFLDEAGGKKIRWHNPSDLLVRIWMHEKMFEAAWATVRKHGASMVLKEELAGASDATHPAEALEVYTSRVSISSAAAAVTRKPRSSWRGWRRCAAGESRLLTSCRSKCASVADATS
jgi:hypothetical protein